ncbi:hypothetical protein pEaSNUABM9_00245 [Erwinia phage pEa_SNUABM_9]|nr:hypothetical protein pEaSNUABM9_00245 [Erwinia phage pEa_SNUABM_9]
MEIFYPGKGELPDEGTYVLAHHTRGTWVDTDQEGCEWVVVKLVRGLSQAERDALPVNDPRKGVISFGDEWGNNTKGYAWNQFGPDSFFAEDIDAWCHIPRGEVPIAYQERDYSIFR